MQWKSGDDILEAVRGYQLACVLTAAADLDIFNALAGAPLDAETLAARIGCELRGTTILADALASADVLNKRDGHYSLSTTLRPFLMDSSPHSVVAMIRHQGTCLRRWARTEWVVQSGERETLEPSIRGAEADYAAFIEAMNVVSSAIADSLVPAVNPGDFGCLLDIGGASGTWTMAWLRCNPAARAILFDLPAVLPQAQQRLQQEGFADRVTLVGGDFYIDPLPKGADLAWVSAIIHQNSREQNRLLFQRIATALDNGGRILIRDIVMEESRIVPPHGAFFAVNMLVGTPRGGTYTLGEIREDLEFAGFCEVWLVRRDEGMHSIVAARKM